MSEPVRKFRWNYKGRTPEGSTCKFSGSGFAGDADEAIKIIEKMMREKFPAMRWMHGREVEGGNVTYGPTVQMLKGSTR